MNIDLVQRGTDVAQILSGNILNDLKLNQRDISLNQ